MNRTLLSRVTSCVTILRLLSGRFRSEVRRLLDGFIPETPKPQKLSLVVERGSRVDLVKTTFDYASRMEIEHLAAHAITRPWIAEAAVHMLESKGDLVAYDRARGIVLSTRQQLSKLPVQASLRYQVLARRAVSLAQLDAVVTRNRRPTFGVRDGVDESGIAAEVESLLCVAQSLWEVASERPLWLQPDFGAVAASVGGASAALLAGSSVINITQATSNSIDRDMLRVMMGDALIAAASELTSIGALRLYQARFGNMVEVELSNELRSDECR